MPETSTARVQKTSSLMSEFSRIRILGGVGLVISCILLGYIWSWPTALQWLIQAALIWAFICHQTECRLHLNRSVEQAPLYKNLGLANRLTLLRSWLIAAVAGFVFQPWPEGPAFAWLPGMIYFFAAILDRVDGYAARRTGQFSLLGTELDTVSDALGLAVAALLAYGYGQVHWSYLLVGIAYYLFHAGMLWRKSRDLPVYPLPPAFHRRAWAGFQMGFLVVALWPLFFPPVTKLAGFAFMTPMLLGFIIDWLFVSGCIKQQAGGGSQRFQKLGVLSHSVLQPALRIAVVVLIVVSVLQSGLPLLPSSSAALLNNILMGGLAFTSLMVLLGIAGRYFSMLLMGLLAWYYITNPLLPVDYVLLCCVIWLLLLGTGRFSLWQEDDHWLNGYDGA
jgi:CDP-diacylglycerol--glycerol-3-phosphate 3-phosphatidyltransferase